MIKRTKKSVALIIACALAVFFGILGIAFLSSSIQEQRLATAFSDSAYAFCMAEAGIAVGYDALMKDASYSGVTWTDPVGDGRGSYRIIISQTSNGLEIRAEGQSGSMTRILTADLATVPYPFQNTISAGDDLKLSGLIAKLNVFGKTRISGSFELSGFWASGTFEDKLEGQPQSETRITIPDYDGDGDTNDFDDFVTYGRLTALDYDEDEVVYIQSDSTINIFPDSELIDKKIVFVEGSSPGEGDVNIFFDATWQEGQDLTVISTGDVTYVEPLQIQEDARLSNVAWEDYNEASIFHSEHESVVFANDDANFIDILEWSDTTGNIIANDDITFSEALTWQDFYFSDRALNGDLPPGFGRLANGLRIVSTKLIDWQEVYE